MQVLFVHEFPAAASSAGADWDYPQFESRAVCSVTQLDGTVLDAAAVVLLDEVLFAARGSCLALCRRLDAELRSEAPVLVIGRSGDLDAKLEAFAAGADDYLARPFERAELIARLQALSRRRRLRSLDATLQVADLQFDPRTCEVRRAGRLVPLGPIGRQVLHLLMTESPRVVTRERLERAIWGEAPPKRDLLRSHMSMLRRAIDAPHPVKLLQTVHGTGFRLIG